MHAYKYFLSVKRKSAIDGRAAACRACRQLLDPAGEMMLAVNVPESSQCNNS